MIVTAMCATCRGEFDRLDFQTRKVLCDPCFSDKVDAARATRNAANAANAVKSVPSSVIDESMLYKLIFLCQPSKHNRCNSSKAATAFLSGLMDR